MRHLAALALATAVVAAVHPRSAAADCAAPQAALSPAPGSVLPADPTVYVFVPSWRDDAGAVVVARAGERALPVQVRRLSANDAFVSYAVAIDTAGPGPIAVQVGQGREVSYQIARRWRRPPQRQLSPVASVHRERSWTCSHTDLWEVTMDGWAPALQVEWATRPDAFDAGAAAVAVFPDRSSAFWWRGDERDSDGPAVVELGHLNCFAHTIPAAAVHGPLYLRVTPLFADGSAGEMGAVVQVGEAGTPPAPEPEPGPIAAAPIAPETAIAPPRVSCVRPLVPPLARTGIAAALAGVLFGLVVAAGGFRQRRVLAAVPASAALAALASVVVWPMWPLLAAAALLIPAALVVGARRSRS